MKSILLVTSFIGAMLLFNGCGEDSDAVDTLENQQMLDEQNYQGVVDKLGSIDEALLTDSENMALGAAYMGKSGVGLSDIIEIMLDSSSDEGSSEDDGFAKFADSIAEKKSDSALSDLKTSNYHYELVVSTCGDENATLTTSQKDVCLNIGLANSVMAVVTIGYLGDVGSLLAGFDSNSTENGDQMDASTCAMQYAFDMNDSNIDTNCLANEDTNVTFTNVATGNTAIYTRLEITMQSTGNKYDYLMTAPTTVGSATYRQTAITDGYCSDTFGDYIESIEDRNITTYPLYSNAIEMHACPANKDPQTGVEDEITSTTMILDALNGGFDSIIAASGGEDSDLGTSIEEFKLEINSDSNGTEDTEITMEDLIAYLNSQE